MPSRLAVFVSQGPSDHPDKRRLEETLADALRGEPDLDVALIPALYDLAPQDPAVAAMRSEPGDLVVLSWLYARAARWVLHYHGVRGRAEESELAPPAVARESSLAGERTAHDPVAVDVAESDRTIYCLDLKTHARVEPLVCEVQRILRQRRNAQRLAPGEVVAPLAPTPPPRAVQVPRRWYPVIDYSRCTHCMECIDFCLFGVYGVDDAERILVEQPDQCRKGCPACSRVCPANAIIFPAHKTPAIAGALGEVAPLKVDLSQVFGAPAPTDDARGAAIAERREHLEQSRPAEPPPGDALDRLLDSLDDFS